MKLKRTKKPLDTNVKLPKDAIFRIFGKMLLDLDILPLSRSLHGAVRQRDVRALLEAASIFNPQSIVEMLGNNKTSRGACTFAKLYQVGALIKKYPFKSKDITNEARAKKALQTFEKYERICELYNSQNYRALCRLSQSHPDYYGLIDDLKREILLLIGDRPDIESVYEQGRHGPGQCTASQFKDGQVTKYFKYSELPYTVSRAARPHAIALISSDPRWMGALNDWYRRKMGIPMWSPICMEDFWSKVLRVYDHSTLTTVPKTAITDRTIEMGPSLNIFLQLGVDAIIRAKLKRGWGYDLNTQERNQKLAYEGSVHDNLATIDLQGASDCVSLKLCELLLPPLWYDLLLELRTASCVYSDGSNGPLRYNLHKMSAMGNGFTFVLETLLFGAAARVAMRRSNSWGKSSVYGDDIIVPSEAANTLIDYLNLMGFSVNKDKTFVTGPFRESCGKDYYNGYDVRPLFITKQIKKVSNLFHLLNSLLLQEKKWEWHDMSYSRVTETLRTWIPEHFALNYLGPQTEDTDTHLFSDVPLRYDCDGYRYFNRLVERAHIQRTPKESYFFRKLMVDLRQVPFNTACPQKWDWTRRLDTGNAFDVTKRGATFFCCVRSYVP